MFLVWWRLPRILCIFHEKIISFEYTFQNCEAQHVLNPFHTSAHLILINNLLYIQTFLGETCYRNSIAHIFPSNGDNFTQVIIHLLMLLAWFLYANEEREHETLMIQHVFFSKVWRNALINDQISSLFLLFCLLIVIYTFEYKIWFVKNVWLGIKSWVWSVGLTSYEILNNFTILKLFPLVKTGKVIAPQYLKRCTYVMYLISLDFKPGLWERIYFYFSLSVSIQTH